MDTLSIADDTLLDDVRDRLHDCTMHRHRQLVRVSSTTAQRVQNGPCAVWQAFPPPSTRQHGADGDRRCSVIQPNRQQFNPTKNLA